MKIEGNGQSNHYSSVLYHDNSALANIKHSNDKQQALETVAGQFEAMFLQMVLRQMRSSSDVLSPEDNPFSSKEQGVYRDFYDGQLAIEMAKKQNSGIADMLVKQLSPKQVGDLAQMVEPVNDTAVSGVSAAKAQEAFTDPSLNEAEYTVAYDLQASFKDTFQEAMGTVAFQQPLIRKMEL